ncbi:hypothetical protein SVA_3148 [Sulfurifustis variabilis]|uniref:DUF2946 domain-containing protein n=1 Tax=Sulfurifustis variabilis TaxID=1675686 RepID=A0A1C7AEU7_9GAMM|nr:hypothetical protein [Sulfurifustis variabilis]BAU49696.1 hypothetical protein SVA_3148 [Sulfurifustis variabilis]
MKSVLASVLAVAVLLASLAWAGEAYCGTGTPLGGDRVAASDQGDSAPTPDVQTHIGHHCGHFGQHLLGEPAAGLPVPTQRPSVTFEAPLVPHLASVIDTPIRPPRAS